MQVPSGFVGSRCFLRNFCVAILINTVDGMYKNPVNTGINYQHQLVISEKYPFNSPIHGGPSDTHIVHKCKDREPQAQEPHQDGKSLPGCVLQIFAWWSETNYLRLQEMACHRLLRWLWVDGENDTNTIFRACMHFWRFLRQQITNSFRIYDGFRPPNTAPVP